MNKLKKLIKSILLMILPFKSKEELKQLYNQPIKYEEDEKA